MCVCDVVLVLSVGAEAVLAQLEGEAFLWLKLLGGKLLHALLFTPLTPVAFPALASEAHIASHTALV